MNDLLELYNNHQGKVSDKWSIYLNEYDRILSSYKDKEINFLEIGVQNGGSLEIWSKYFDSAQKIIGCDINPKCGELVYEDPRIEVIVGDACNSETKKQILNHAAQFDVIIEDGSHTSSDIIKTFALYFQNLKYDGVFIFEDLHCSYWQAFEGGLYDPYSSMNFFKALSDVINYQHWGVEKDRNEFLAGFEEKYGINFDGLDEIHSIEFFNSVCVIKKKKSDANQIGKRFISGCNEDVVDGHLRPDFPLDMPEPIQVDNAWSNLDRSPAEQWLSINQNIEKYQQKLEDTTQQLEDTTQQLEDTTQQLDETTQQLDETTQQLERANREIENTRFALNLVVTSKSWKLTQPLRSTKQFFMLGKKAVRYYKTFGLRQFFKKLKAKATNQDLEQMAPNHQSGYRYIEPVLNKEVLKEIKRFQFKPLISIIMPVYNVETKWLDIAIKSVERQWYKNWELCIADDASTNKETLDYLKSLSNPKIKVKFLTENKGISGASNAALDLALGDYIALMDNDDEITSNALYEVVKALNQSDANIIYSDEDKIDGEGNHSSSHFKSDWNPDLFYSQNYVSHLGVYKTGIIKKIGGFRIGVEGAQDQDLLLRCLPHVKHYEIIHIPKVLYHWRMIEGSTALTSGEKSYTTDAGIKALSDYFKENGPAGITVEKGMLPNTYKVNWPIPKPEPLVSLLIPTRDRKQLTQVAVESILKKTIYQNYEIIILDNGSEEKETLDWFEKIQKQDRRVKVLRYDHPFNYSAINNYGVEHSNGSIIGLINNDIEVISPDWLSEMVSHASRQDIGCVGAKLYYSNNLIQHAGVIMGIGGVAGHSHKMFDRNHDGHFSRLKLVQNYSAVTGACLLVRRELYNMVTGLNSINLKVAFNDIDLCLKINEEGYRTLWTPYSEMYHHESASRGDDSVEKENLDRLNAESSYMYCKWGEVIENDPYYNLNLTRDDESFHFDGKIRGKLDFEGAIFYEWLSKDHYEKKKYVCVFVGFDSESKLHEYVLYYLKELKKYFDIYFITTAENMQKDRGAIYKLQKLCKAIIVRKNEGYDFGSWKLGIERYYSEIKDYDGLLLANDSVYGPLFDLKAFIKKFERSQADIFGMTDSNEIGYHLQSYFVMYKKQVINDEVFKRFWANVSIQGCKWDVIKKYEIGFSHQLIHCGGYKLDAYCDMGNYPVSNYMHTNWRELVTVKSCPFIKVELVKKNPINADISDLRKIVSDISNYSYDLIESHNK